MRKLAQLLNENHRYFPEWADRPGVSGPPVEADHNSYLAGGYSEEFGYRVSVDQPPVFAPLEGDPDSNRLWYVQVTGLHPEYPEYPECARPDDRDMLAPCSASANAVSRPMRFEAPVIRAVLPCSVCSMIAKLRRMNYPPHAS